MNDVLYAGGASPATEKTAAVNALAEQASASASSAASSSSAAQTAASAAANSANEALKSADNAAAAASNAADYASQAEDSAGAAKTSETNAESSATAASGSAASAEAFKTAAESAATVANEKAAAVSESALAAAESATAAASAADTAEAWAVGSIEERPEGSAKYWAEKINPDNLADVDLSNLSSVGKAKLPHPWVYFAAKNMLANGTIGANKVSTFALDFLPDEGLYEIIGSVFFTSSSIVTVRGALNPSIYDAIASSPTAGVFLTTGESRCAGFYAALVKNKTIRFSNTGNNEATNGYINVFAYRKVGD